MKVFKSNLKKKYSKTKIEKSSALVDDTGKITGAALSVDDAIYKIMSIDIPTSLPPEIVLALKGFVIYELLKLKRI